MLLCIRVCAKCRKCTDNPTSLCYVLYTTHDEYTVCVSFMTCV